MNKTWIALLFLSVLSVETAMAVERYRYDPNEEGCVLRKEIGRKWEKTDASVTQGKTFELRSESNSKNAYIKIGNTRYGDRAKCFKRLNAHKRFLAELRGSYSVMTGSGSEETSGNGSVKGISASTLTGKYSPDLGYNARFGYLISDSDIIYLEGGYFSGGTSNTIKISGISYSGTTSEKMISFDLGYQKKVLTGKLFGGKLVPYLGASLGLSLLDGSISYPTLSALNTLSYSVMTPHLNLGVGTTYSLSDIFSFVFSLDYIFLTYKEADITESSDSTDYPVGGKLGSSMSYDHICLGLGIRILF